MREILEKTRNLRETISGYDSTAVQASVCLPRKQGVMASSPGPYKRTSAPKTDLHGCECSSTVAHKSYIASQPNILQLISGLENPCVHISELHNIRRLVDFDTLKLRNVWSVRIRMKFILQGNSMLVFNVSIWNNGLN